MSDYKCPMCKSEEYFKVTGLASPRCEINGAGDVLDYSTGDIEWDANNSMACGTCGHKNVAGAFQAEAEAAKKKKAGKRINTKVERLLERLAVLVKDEKPILIEAMDDLINDRIQRSNYIVTLPGDGYPFDFKGAAASYKRLVVGKSY